MKKLRKSIVEIKEEIYDTLGGIAGAVKYYKRHPSAFYPDYFKTPPQPLIQNNLNVGINAEAAGNAARAELELAFIRLIESRKHDGDPAVYVDGERLRDDGRLIEHQPRLSDEAPRSSDDAQPATADHGGNSNSENLKSPKKGTVFSRGGVATSSGETTPAGGKNKISNYPNPLSGGFAVALDGLDDHLSTTERFLLWKGHGGPP